MPCPGDEAKNLGVAPHVGYHVFISGQSSEFDRTVWATRLTFRAQVSLPTMIYDHDTDTELPHNFFDEEFGPQTKILPPSRPLTEPTPMAYMITKTRMCIEFGNVLQAVTRVGRPVQYDEILMHDKKLREIADEMPPHLKMQSLEGSHDPVTLIIARFNLSLLHQKILCMLHRKHLIRARQNPRYAYSRRTAIETSLASMENLRTIYRECQPNGRLRTMKWYVHSTARDTMLSTMLVLLDLHHDTLDAASGSRHNSQALYFWTPEQHAEMISSLEAVKDIWKTMAQESVEAFKAGNILELMLKKIKNPSPQTQEAEPMKPDLNLFGNFDSADMQPEHSAAMTLGMLSSGLTPSYQSPGGTNYPPPDISADAGTGLTPSFQGDGLPGISNAASPFSMFNAGDMALDQTLDWVCVCFTLISLHEKI